MMPVLTSYLFLNLIQFVWYVSRSSGLNYKVFELHIVSHVIPKLRDNSRDNPTCFCVAPPYLAQD